MKSVVLYDTGFGNTEQIARAIADTLGPVNEAGFIKADKANAGQLEDIELLIVGSPTYGARPTEALSRFLDGLPGNALDGVKTAAFDTRIDVSTVGFVPRLFCRIAGFAAGRIGKTLEKKGGTQIVEPEGFLVTGKEGPLGEGEKERAGRWAESIMKAAAP